MFEFYGMTVEKRGDMYHLYEGRRLVATVRRLPDGTVRKAYGVLSEITLAMLTRKLQEMEPVTASINKH